MKLRQILPSLVALLCAHFLIGCATVTRGTTEELIVQSTPTGATVKISNGMTAVTPATFKVPRKGDIVVTVSMPGYKTAEVISKAEVSKTGAAGFAGNLLIGGVVGGVADAVTGAALSHFPNPVVVTLEPLGKSQVAAETAKTMEPEKPAAQATSDEKPPGS
jgi:hypothetical protein